MDEYEDETQNADPGTAFPIVHPDGRGVQYFGLTMRDYFAAKAISAAAELSDCHKDSMPAAIARNAYAIADAMLAARTK